MGILNWIVPFPFGYLLNSIFSSEDENQHWSIWLLSTTLTIGVSTIFFYKCFSWLKRRFIIAKSKNRRDVIILGKTKIDLNRQSIVLPGPERIRVSVLADGKDGTDYLITLDPNVTTLYENFLRGMKKSEDGQCLGYRFSNNEPFRWLTYGEILKQAHCFGAGLIRLGLEPGKSSSFIGIYARNCPEWIIASMGCMSYNTAVVPLYDTLGLEAVQFIIQQADIEIVVCDSYEKAEKLLSSSNTTHRLRHIVFMRDIDTLKEESRGNVRLHRFDDIVKIGSENPHRLILPKPDDLYMICYTSGTTGNPKGVMLTHKNLLCNASAGIRYFDEYGISIEPGESVISYLPLAHMFEQMVHVLMFFYGGKIGIFQGDINSLPNDLKALKPTYLPAVPRLLNRFYDKVQSTLSSSPLKRLVFTFALRRKFSEMRKGIIRRNSFWDRLIFSKIQKEIGGNVRFIVTGSAPIRDEVLTMIRSMLGCLVLEAYGQTECTAAATLTLPNDFTSGHVGGPIPCCHVKLIDAPELEYFSKNDEGEICVRGPSVTKGYFHDPERTKEILDADGWLRTGDVGRWLPNGTLKIIDRKKHIFKLAQGEYVAPEKIENVYSRSPLVSQVFVDGNSFQRYLVAIVVPDEMHLKELVPTKNGTPPPNLADLCSDKEIRTKVLAELTKIGKKLGLNSIEQIKAIHLSSEPFSIDNSLLTPTMKLKRSQLRKHFQSIIEDLYKEGGQ
jgi:long-chain acyl-CoA synthetase